MARRAATQGNVTMSNTYQVRSGGSYVTLCASACRAGHPVPSFRAPEPAKRQREFADRPEGRQRRAAIRAKRERLAFCGAII